MTVTYTSEVATSRGISCFLKLLARWRGSIYKIVWTDLIFFLGLYYILNIAYRIILANDDTYSKELFEKVVIYCGKYASSIPLSFVLGFYVNLVMGRWWSQYSSIPFPDNLAILVGASIKGQHERARIVRRTIVRYVCVTFTITLTMISPKVKRRFPTWDHYIDAGLLTRDEKKIIEDMDNEFPSYSKYWLPLAWASNIVTRARHEGLIYDDVSVKTLLEELNLFRSRCGGLLDYDWISVPLVYTQVVTIAVYTYFIANAIGKQYIEPKGEPTELDVYFPIFPVLEFFFYMGWLKVAETLINPFGEDDDDFEVVWMVDRNVQVSYLLVDKIHQEHPKLMRDQHWYETAPNVLPYTIASQNYMQEYPLNSTFNVTVKKSDQDLIVQEDSQVDSSGRRSGPYTWKLSGKSNLKQRKRDVPLRRVVSLASRGEPYDINNYDDSVISKIPTNPTKITFSEDFENLKEARKKEHKERVRAFLESLKKSKVEELEKLMDDSF